MDSRPASWITPEPTRATSAESAAAWTAAFDAASLILSRTGRGQLALERDTKATATGGDGQDIRGKR